MPTAPSLDFFVGVLKCGIQVALKPSGVESAKQSSQGSSIFISPKKTKIYLIQFKVILLLFLFLALNKSTGLYYFR